MIRDVKTLKQKLQFMKMNLAHLAGIRRGMQVLDVGCGQGTFTSCVAELVGDNGKVVAVDITDEYLEEMSENLNKQGIRNRVKFVKADAAELPAGVTSGFDVAVSYRLIEELTHPEKSAKILSEMAKAVRHNGTVSLIELSTETANIAEENLIRLHRDIGRDYFPDPKEILQQMKNAGLRRVHARTVETDIWYSPTVFLKGAGSQDEVWTEFREEIMRELWPSVTQHGMKYPPINLLIGRKQVKKTGLKS